MACPLSQVGGQHYTLTAAAVAWLLLCLPPAVAQHNSLLPGRPAPTRDSTPTTDPAATIGSAGPDPRAAAQEGHQEARTNVTLLRRSPFAVEAPKAEQFRVHDQVTIIVRESKTATTDSKLESNKDWKFDSALKKWLRLSDDHGIVPAKFEFGNPEVLFGFKNDYKGDGKYDRKDELTTRIQATIIDVKPNGTLVLEAQKDVEIDEEGYTITLTGGCRARDVTPQNTILSTQIAGLDIKVKHKGAVRDATRRGWLMRGLDFLRPF